MTDVEKGQINHGPLPQDRPPAPAVDANPNQGWYSVPGPLSHTPRRSTIGNPGALGLFSFASTTFILSLYNVQARHILIPNVVVGMALFCGGLGQLLAGMWEFPRGNQFGGTAFVSYGVFWMSFGTIYIPDSGILAAYADNADELHQALGIYLMTWFVFTTLLLIGAIRRNWTFVFLLSGLSLTFLLLAVAQFNGVIKIQKAGGAFGIITAWIAYYAAVSELLVKEESYFMLPLGEFSRRRD